MTPTAIAMMLVAVGTIWGALVLAVANLVRASRRSKAEAARSRS